jgi:hypothetical protein
MSEEQVNEQEETTQETATSGTEGVEAKTETDDTSLLGQKSEEEVPENVIPETYEFKLPEGRELDNGLVEKFTPVLKELKIGQEGAQKLAELLVADQAAKEQTYREITEGWKQDTIKELGSDYQAKLGVAAKFIDRFGNDQVRQVLNDTGLGNHPEVVKMFINAGKHFSDDTVPTGTRQTNLSDPERLARKMFPNTKYD